MKSMMKSSSSSADDAKLQDRATNPDTPFPEYPHNTGYVGEASRRGGRTGQADWLHRHSGRWYNGFAAGRAPPPGVSYTWALRRPLHAPPPPPPMAAGPGTASEPTSAQNLDTGNVIYSALGADDQTIAPYEAAKS